MIKKTIYFGLILIICLGLFSGCNQETNDGATLTKYKIEEKTAIEIYSQERQNNYSAENWAIICGIVADGKATIDAAESMEAVDLAVNEVKTAIDGVSPKESENMGEIAADDFSLLVSVDKVNFQIGEKIIVTAILENLSNKDILCEVPDWIAVTGGQQAEDLLKFFCIPCDSGFDWTVNSIAVEPRPRVILKKGAKVERIFEYTVSESNNVEVHVGAFFYIGEANNSRFNQQISLINNPIIILIER